MVDSIYFILIGFRAKNLIKFRRFPRITGGGLGSKFFWKFGRFLKARGQFDNKRKLFYS